MVVKQICIIPKLSGNKAKVGGGIFAYGADSTNKNANLNVYNSLVKDNEATSGSSGINMF